MSPPYDLSDLSHKQLFDLASDVLSEIEFRSEVIGSEIQDLQRKITEILRPATTAAAIVTDALGNGWTLMRKYIGKETEIQLIGGDFNLVNAPFEDWSMGKHISYTPSNELSQNQELIKINKVAVPEHAIVTLCRVIFNINWFGRVVCDDVLSRGIMPDEFPEEYLRVREDFWNYQSGVSKQ